MKQEKKRIYWIDAIKALCIFSVMISHGQFSQSQIRVDYFFLVGFFFASGYVFNEEYSFRKRCCKIVDGLYIPYLIMPFIMFFFIKNNLCELINGDSLEVLKREILKCITGHSWFLQVLISIEFIYVIWIKFVKIHKVWLFLICLSLYMGGVLNQANWPWRIHIAFYGLLFFIIGIWMKSAIFKFPILRKSTIIIMVILFIMLSDIVFPKYPFNTSLSQFNNVIILFVMNIVGIIVLYYVSSIIPQSKYIDYLGQNSLVIYFIHIPFVYYIYQLLLSWTKDTWIDNTFSAVIYTFFITLILYPIVVLLNKYAAILVGKGKLTEKKLLK